MVNRGTDAIDNQVTESSVQYNYNDLDFHCEEDEDEDVVVYSLNPSNLISVNDVC